MAHGQALLVTGAYGAGKTSVIDELAERMEDQGLSYGAIDLDWLLWFDADIDDARRQEVFLANLKAVAGNYRDAGVARLMLAGAIRDAQALDGLRAALPFPLRVVRLTLPLAATRTRLGSAVTSGRADDLAAATDWIAQDIGVGMEDIAVSNDRPLRETVQEITDWLGWMAPQQR